jgi:hypothetical protein
MQIHEDIRQQVQRTSMLLGNLMDVVGVPDDHPTATAVRETVARLVELTELIPGSGVWPESAGESGPFVYPIVDVTLDPRLWPTSFGWTAGVVIRSAETRDRRRLRTRFSLRVRDGWPRRRVLSREGWLRVLREAEVVQPEASPA